MSDERYISSTQQTGFAVVKLLAEHPLDGIGAGDVRSRLDITRDQAYRALRNVELAGWAEEHPKGSGLWRATPGLSLLADSVRRAIADRLHAHFGDSR